MGIETIIAVILGLIAGGIINVLADDLPLRRSLRFPVYLSDEKKRAIHIPDENIDEILSKPDEARPPLAWLGITAFLFGLGTRRRYPALRPRTTSIATWPWMRLNGRR